MAEVLAMTISAALEFYSRVNASADSEPPVGIEKTDLSMKNGISISF